MKSTISGNAKTPRPTANKARQYDPSKVLAQAHDEALARIHVLRHEEQADAVELPADRLDVARSLEDVETDAGLIERYEFQLKQIDAAFSRLERGRYGICEKCKEQIAIERLRAMPFAAYCLDCQKERNDRSRPGEGEVDEPSRHVWTPPEELKESVEE